VLLPVPGAGFSEVFVPGESLGEAGGEEVDEGADLGREVAGGGVDGGDREVGDAPGGQDADEAAVAKRVADDEGRLQDDAGASMAAAQRASPLLAMSAPSTSMAAVRPPGPMRRHRLPVAE